MKTKLSFLLFLLPVYLPAQDSIPPVKDTNEVHRFSFFLHTDFVVNFGKSKMTGAGLIYSFDKLKIIGSFSIKHPPLFFAEDTTYTILPYAINDSSVFYEVRSYTNQKYHLSLGLETNFKPFKKYALQLGMLAHWGKYKFQDYQADTYYDYYRDSSTGQVYYHDIYGYPSWDPLDAFTHVLRYSKADMEYRMLGFEPYIDFYSDFSKSLRTSIYFSAKYEQFAAIKRDYLDYAGVLNNPPDKFHQWRFNICLRFIINIA